METVRKLASIQKVIDIKPIEGADRIEVATILGWQLVVKKGEFKIGDYCVYCEIDSILPDKPQFEFLRKKKFRIKTMKMRGQISQGIAFPLSILGDETNIGFHINNIISNTDFEEMCLGQDITEELGITKYELPIPANMAGKVKGNFPSFIPKTSETRIQNIPYILEKYKGTHCYISEKLDGTSVTYYLKDDIFGVVLVI